jgi:hypothetical protein
VFSGQVGQAHAFHHELIAPVGDVRLTGQPRGREWSVHREGAKVGSGERVFIGIAAGAGAGGLEGAVEGGTEGVVAGLDQGLSVWVKVARPADSGVLGAYKGPFWPHPVKIAAPPTRACAVTRICKNFNMHRL